MALDVESFGERYADRIWSLLPAYYRDLDISRDGEPGPVRSLVNRFGVQAAVLRRSIDRMWEDQSIESSDDWVIPYLADLVATRLVSGLDSRGQRLDVYRTIHYRRRKGTVGVLEQIATDITGWDARVVEFFRRLGRTRHNFDPEIGLAPEWTDPVTNPDLRLPEGLVGQVSGTGIGGFADLRSVYGARRTGGAYDEYFHTADVRRGAGRFGWYLIPRLGVFVWRLHSLEVVRATPVACAAGLLTFDPTGRLIPLFARAHRTPSSYGSEWVTPEEWQLPGPIDSQLLLHELDNLYPASIQVLRIGSGLDSGMPADEVVVHPEIGTFRIDPTVANQGVVATYCYGFPARIGAGPYDRRVLGHPELAIPGPTVLVSGGGAALNNALTAAGGAGTILIGDSLTYQGAPDVVTTGPLALRAANRQRPLMRSPGLKWTITGSGGQLILDGLFLSGTEVVIKGDFELVRITCCTLDPGSAGTGKLYATAVDGADLVPSRLWIDGGDIQRLEIERSITASVRTRNGGQVERLVMDDSIVQSIPTTLNGALTVAQLIDAGHLGGRLRDAGAAGATSDRLGAWLYSSLPKATQSKLDAFAGFVDPPGALVSELVQQLEVLIDAGSMYKPSRFSRVRLTPDLLAEALDAAGKTPIQLRSLNRRLLAAAYPLELDDLALGLGEGLVEITRCTIDGRGYVHRLEASECILADVFQVEDTQHGCVRFCAWSDGSVLPRQYESVSIVPRAAVFSSRAFGNPTFMQLAEGADLAITSGATTISAGGREGSELGVYASELYPVKARGLHLKLDEFMPLGLDPVIINVT